MRVPIGASVTTHPEPPAAPSLDCSGRTKNSITLRWNVPPSHGAAVDEYELAWDGGDATAPVERFSVAYVGTALKHKA